MTPATLALLPDDLTGTIRLLRVEAGGQTAHATASLASIRTGEDGFARGDTRRYELPSHSNSDPADLIARRVVMSDDALSEIDRLPKWARQTVALHPDRHDLARWMGAARSQAKSPWVAHLPLVMRDALRRFKAHHPLTMVLPDRAFLAATNDDQDAVAPLAQPFVGTAFEIDERCRRTGAELAPMPLAVNKRVEHRSGLATRAETVIAEALMNCHDASQMPSMRDVEARWQAAVDSDHIGRLRQVGPSEFVAPLAILDDHRDQSFRATLILATVHIALTAEARDLWIEYHEAVEVNASRPLALDLEARLRVGSDASLDNRNALLACLSSGSLPVLELSTRCDGEFDNRQLMSVLPDAVPFLRDHPGYSFPEAVLAFQRFRTGSREVFGPTTWLKMPWLRRKPEAAHAGGGGDHALPDADPDARGSGSVEMPPEQKHAPDPDKHVGDPDQKAHEPDHDGSVGQAGEDTTGQGEQQASGPDEHDSEGDIPDIGVPLESNDQPGDDKEGTDGEGDADGTAAGRAGGGDTSGSGQLRADPGDDGDAAAVARQLSQAMGHKGQGGDHDHHGTASDPLVANSTDMPPEQENASDPDQHVGDPDQQAHEPVAKEPAIQPTTWLPELLARMSDADAQHVREIRARVAQMDPRSGPPGLIAVPEDNLLKQHAALVSKVLYRTEFNTLRTGRHGTRKTVAKVRALFEAEAVWLRLLLALNVAGVIEREGLASMKDVTIERVALSAEQVHAQALAAMIAIPAPAEAPAANSGAKSSPSSNAGGRNG